MTRAIQARGPKRDTNSKTAEMVELISEIGPDIPEIARRLGQYKESVRYRYKKKILGRGIAIQVAVDHEKLGLRRVVFLLEFAEEYSEYAQSILTAMSELCYVVSFAATMPEGWYVVDASVPEEFVGRFSGFLRALEEKGLFKCDKMLVFDWIRTVPMRAKFYDFDTGRWDFEWSGRGRPDASGYLPSPRSEFDYTDLLIMKEFRVDATKSLAEVAKKLGVNYKKLAWHYATHVRERHLIRGFVLNWMGTRYDFRLEKALHRMHRYFHLDVLAEDLSEVERMELMSKINALPFVWAEAGGRNYWAQLAFPVDNIVEAYQYLTETIKPVKDKTRLLVIDQTNALSFTISYKLYNQRKNAWLFDSQLLLTKFEDLLLKIRQSAG